NNGFSTSGCATADALAKSSAMERVRAAARMAAARTSAHTPLSSAQAELPPQSNGGNSKKVRPFDRKGVTALAIQSDGNTIASASTDNQIRIFSSTTGSQSLDFSDSAGLPTGLVFSPDGSTLSSVGRDSVVRLWDTAAGRELAELPGHDQALRAIAV